MVEATNFTSYFDTEDIDWNFTIRGDLTINIKSIYDEVVRALSPIEAYAVLSGVVQYNDYEYYYEGGDILHGVYLDPNKAKDEEKSVRHHDMYEYDIDPQSEVRKISIQ